MPSTDLPRIVKNGSYNSDSRTAIVTGNTAIEISVLDSTNNNDPLVSSKTDYSYAVSAIFGMEIPNLETVFLFSMTNKITIKVDYST